MGDQWNYDASYSSYNNNNYNSQQQQQQQQQWYDWNNQYYHQNSNNGSDANNYTYTQQAPPVVHNYYSNYNYHLHYTPGIQPNNTYCDNYATNQVSYDYKQELELYRNTKNQYDNKDEYQSMKEDQKRSRSKSSEKKREYKYR